MLRAVETSWQRRGWCLVAWRPLHDGFTKGFCRGAACTSELPRPTQALQTLLAPPDDVKQTRKTSSFRTHEGLGLKIWTEAIYEGHFAPGG